MSGKSIIIILAVALGILHQDFWNWDNDTLVFGFMPMGLFYHACFSLAAAILWVFAIKYAWPTKLVEWAEQDQSSEETKDA
ncbi:MAG: DUF3311 domain-containing protein [Verrucomicrobiales bacterium]